MMDVEEPLPAKFQTQIESLMEKTTSDIVKLFVEVLLETRAEISRSWREIDELKQKLEESEEQRAEAVLRSQATCNFKRETEDVLVSHDVLQTPKDATFEHTGMTQSVKIHEPSTLQALHGSSGIDQCANNPDQSQEAQLSQTLLKPKRVCPDKSFGITEHQKSITESEVVANSPLQAISMVSHQGPSCSPPTLASDSPKTEALAFTTECVADNDIQDEKPAVDEKGIPGFHHVERLANYLVELRNLTTRSLNNQQVSTISELWQNLESWDKQRIVYVSLYQDRLTKGHFRSPEKEDSLTPGMENSTRSTLEANSSIHPDCCRLVEAIFVRLCNIHFCRSKKDEGTLTNWTSLLQDYRKIREILLGNGVLMQATSLQLVEVNQNALIQWHNHRTKNQGLTELLKDDLSPSLPEAENPLVQPRTVQVDASPQQEHPPDYSDHIKYEGLSELLKEHISPSAAGVEEMQARAHPTEFTQPQISAYEHRPPESSAGQAFLKRKTIAEAPSIRPKLPMPPVFGPAPEAAQYLQMVPHISVRGPPVLQAVHVLQPMPAFVCTSAQKSVPQHVTLESPHPRQKRTYNRVVQGNTCKKCGQFRSAVTGHSQYKGIIYCPQTETVDKKQWLEDMRRQWK